MDGKGEKKGRTRVTCLFFELKTLSFVLIL
jgi:hypothetical protein